MTITVLTPATSKRLTTIYAVKEELRLDQDDETPDPHLGRLIDQASAAVERFTARVFAKETVKEELPATGRVTLLLSRTPIGTITSVKIDGDAITDFSIRDADAGVLFRKAEWPTSEFSGHNIESFLTGETKNIVEVQYDGGYVLPGAEETLTPTLPADVERACIETVKGWWLARERDPAIQSEKIGSFWSATYKAGEVPDSARALLTPWRRLA